MGDLLERGVFLQELSTRLDGAREGRGALVFVAGEAGVGKTTLARKFCELASRTATIAWGICDPLSTPSALGPVVEIVAALDEELAQSFQEPRHRRPAFRSLLDLLRPRGKPFVLVVEDAHWADEATLDFLRFAGRRIDETAALLIATYRDDEVGTKHPVRVMLGDLAPAPAVHRMALPPLSESAVGVLAKGSGLDPILLHRRTGGNPFFVTEILASGKAEIPATVLDAILARASRLSKPAHRVLEACATIGARVEPWLLESVLAPASEAVDECLSLGLLCSEGAGLAFRHELARQAILRALSPQSAFELHRAALAALRTSPLATSDPARLAHHAEAASDGDAVLSFAPEAARRSAALGAHREAAAQYARALRFANDLPLKERAELLTRHSYECHLTEQHQEAIEAQERALECYRRLGDRRSEGDALRWLSRLLWFAGRVSAAEETGRQALALLEQLPPGRELALAYANLTQLSMNAEDAVGTITWGTKAIELATHLDDAEIRIHALNSIGTIEFLRGEPEGLKKLEESQGLARRAGLDYDVGRAFCHLAWGTVSQRLHALADHHISAGLEYCNDRDLYLTRSYLLALRARSELDQGRWAEAADAALLVLGDPRRSPIARVPALVSIGLVRARRGDPDARPPLDEAHALAERSGELQCIAPLAAAKAEVAWLAGQYDVVAKITAPALQLALKHRSRWALGELASWRRRAGIQEDIPAEVAEPYDLELRGHWRRSADLWKGLGCPYEAAFELVQCGEEDALRQALEAFAGLGARPMVAIVTQKLRRLGVRAIPRGPQGRTRANPAGLTAREAEILRLVADGLPSAQIARRLFLAPKTVEHHVSSVLSKLGARSRGEAVKEAIRRRLITFPASSTE